MGVSLLSYVTKYCSNPDSVLVWLVVIVLLSINSSFIPLGCQAGQLCQVPEAVWQPVCGFQHQLFSHPTCLLSFLVRQVKTLLHSFYSLLQRWEATYTLNAFLYKLKVVLIISIKLNMCVFVAGLFTVFCLTAGRSLGRTGPGGCSMGFCWCYRLSTSFGSTSLLALRSKPYSRERLVPVYSNLYPHRQHSFKAFYHL